MKKILVIRDFEQFSRILTENDFEVINLPLVETKALADLSDFAAKLKTIEKYDGIFLTSRKAAQILAETFDELKVRFSGKVYVLGKRSFEILKNRNLDLIFYEDANNAEEMLETILPDELKDKGFLFVRGEKSLETIPNFLRNVAAVDEAIVYSSQPIFPGVNQIAEIAESIENREITAICFFSPSQAENFIEQFGAQILHQTKIAVIGKTTAEFFEASNLKADFIAPKASAKDFADGLIKFLEERNL